MPMASVIAREAGNAVVLVLVFMPKKIEWDFPQIIAAALVWLSICYFF
jgi:hypothetical protein